MLWNLIFILVAIGIAFGFAQLASFKSSWILVPENVEDPVPYEPGTPLLYRFMKYNQVQDKTSHRPRYVLSLFLFVLAALMLKIFFQGNTHWGTFMLGTLVTIVAASAMMLNVLMVGAVLFLTYLLWVISGWLGLVNPGYLGLASGLLCGTFAGRVVGQNYLKMVQTLKMTLEQNETLQGEPLSSWKKIYLKGYQYVLTFMPWVILYKVVSFWWGNIDIDNISNDIQTLLLGKYVLLFISLGLGLNIILFSVPLFRETLESTTVDSCANFTDKVRTWEQTWEDTKDQEGPEDFAVYRQEFQKYANEEYEALQLSSKQRTATNLMSAYLGKKGQWMSFQDTQLASLWVVVLVFGLGVFGQTVGKAIHMGVVDGAVMASKGWSIKQWVQFSLGFTLWTQIALFFYAHPVKRLAELGYNNAKAFWLSTRDPELRLLCSKEEDSSDTELHIYKPGVEETSPQEG